MTGSCWDLLWRLPLPYLLYLFSPDPVDDVEGGGGLEFMFDLPQGCLGIWAIAYRKRVAHPVKKLEAADN